VTHNSEPNSSSDLHLTVIYLRAHNGGKSQNHIKDLAAQCSLKTRFCIRFKKLCIQTKVILSWRQGRKPNCL